MSSMASVSAPVAGRTGCDDDDEPADGSGSSTGSKGAASAATGIGAGRTGATSAGPEMSATPSVVVVEFGSTRSGMLAAGISVVTGSPVGAGTAITSGKLAAGINVVDGFSDGTVVGSGMLTAGINVVEGSEVVGGAVVSTVGVTVAGTVVGAGTDGSGATVVSAGRLAGVPRVGSATSEEGGGTDSVADANPSETARVASTDIEHAATPRATEFLNVVPAAMSPRVRASGLEKSTERASSALSAVDS